MFPNPTVVVLMFVVLTLDYISIWQRKDLATVCSMYLACSRSRNHMALIYNRGGYIRVCHLI